MWQNMTAPAEFQLTIMICLIPFIIIQPTTIYIIFQEGLTISTNMGLIAPSSDMAISKSDANCLYIEVLSLLFGFGTQKTMIITKK